MESNYSFNLVCLDQVTSTNEVLFRAPFAQYPLGTALLARRQTAGRGRADRTWFSNEGGMYLSVLFLPRVVEGLTLLGALCVIRMCREELGLPVELRWPNDVYHEGRKLCGVLPQVKYHGQEIERVVLGVGLNVNQPPDTFPQTLPATTLSQCYPGHAFEVRDVASRYLEVLAEEMEPYQRDGCHALAKRCERYLEGKGREVGLSSSDGTLRNLGRVSGLSPSGELLLDSGERLSQMSTEERLVFF